MGKPRFVVRVFEEQQGEGSHKQKIFINMCSAKDVAEPRLQEGGWAVPSSMGPARTITTKGGAVRIFDVLFGEEAMDRAGKDVPYKKLLVQTAIEAVEEETHKHISRSAIKLLPSSKIVGNPAARLSSKQPSPAPTKPPAAISKVVDVHPRGTEVPKYTITTKNAYDLASIFEDTRIQAAAAPPSTVIVRVALPKCTCATEIAVDVEPSKFILDVPNKYHLEVALPRTVRNDTVRAKFDCSTASLEVTLDELPRPQPQQPQPHRQQLQPQQPHFLPAPALPCVSRAPCTAADAVYVDDGDEETGISSLPRGLLLGYHQTTAHAAIRLACLPPLRFRAAATAETEAEAAVRVEFALCVAQEAAATASPAHVEALCCAPLHAALLLGGAVHTPRASVSAAGDCLVLSAAKRVAGLWPRVVASVVVDAACTAADPTALALTNTLVYELA
eukprot:TRINITY_DN8243_c0_g1_i1.p1 TRINITY_DN8243_c0_g1~~TRINITY_DN8243_c0_g1_i1.p1  ORF type:complete len:502 (-),score=142.52 TRINITY_DN8243_c0_g1_i1:51-1388(-)